MKNSESNRCKYDSYHNIPARVFFEIRESGDFQLMRPKPSTSTKWLAKLFVQIYDDYFIKSGNKDAARYSELLEIEAVLTAKIAAFKSVLEFHWTTPVEIWNHPTVVMIRTEQINALNGYLDIPIDLEADFDAEVQTALNVSLGIIQNDLSECQMELLFIAIKCFFPLLLQSDFRKAGFLSFRSFLISHSSIAVLHFLYCGILLFELFSQFPDCRIRPTRWLCANLHRVHLSDIGN